MPNDTTDSDTQKQDRLATLRTNYTQAYNVYVDMPGNGADRDRAETAMNNAEALWI